jgi:peptidoglycan/LPS O-acetylase OafA/YrhL
VRGWRPSSRGQWIAILAAYVVVACVFVGVAYWISPDNLSSAISPVVGGLIGLLLLSTPPARRWLARIHASRWSERPPDGR